ncbi:hypothetical protein SAMN06296273_2911 [Nitrosomonas ureae]|uniref:Uncharacterized protein n=1 Tax=Nitrosomonas ureae TaxID=44577 RepID=A0A285C1K1_9PROT|nr:hypothetical protein [Nitrosomonas ureae]SNX61461.1 hypothetical protein SAMN06296273_2911 [Nitrosomonas ureae]
MADIFFDVNSNIRAVGSIRRGVDGNPQSLDASIADGDTIGFHCAGSGSLRFLGVDTPEKNFQLPGSSAHRRLDSEEWENYLTDPFLPHLGPYNLDADLIAYLRPRLGPGAGINHRFHGNNAEQTLIAHVQADMDALGQDPNTFGYFLSFSFEVFDSYGRFLAFINRNQPDAHIPGPRPFSYNERQLERGMALPYFIWPNIAPFRKGSLLEAVFAPGTARRTAEASADLSRARNFVRQARANGIGVFNPADPLRLEAFEVRYLGRRELPSRAVIDLSRDDDVILQAQHYFRIPNAEDRLFIPPAFIPLFVMRGWRLEGWF